MKPRLLKRQKSFTLKEADDQFIKYQHQNQCNLDKLSPPPNEEDRYFLQAVEQFKADMNEITEVPDDIPLIEANKRQFPVRSTDSPQRIRPSALKRR